MTIPTFDSLGISDKPLVDSWEIPQAFREPLQTDMDGDNKRLRAMPGGKTARIQFSIIYSKAHFETFKMFVRDTLNQGTMRFTMRVWNGTSMVSRTVQFASVFKTSTNEPKVVVTLDLWVYGGL